jgi:predicted ester cyclase
MPPDYVDHEGVPGYPPTREGFKQSIPMLRSGIPDFNATIDDVVAEGDRVVIRMTFRGTQTGEFMGMPPTGKSISVGVIDIFRIAGGKIVEHWGQMDSMGMMQQLGAMPAPGQSGS